MNALDFSEAQNIYKAISKVFLILNRLERNELVCKLDFRGGICVLGLWKRTFTLWEVIFHKVEQFVSFCSAASKNVWLAHSFFMFFGQKKKKKEKTSKKESRLLKVC